MSTAFMCWKPSRRMCTGTGLSRAIQASVTGLLCREIMIYVQVTDGSGNEGYSIIGCTLEDDGRTTVEEKVSALVAECSAAGCGTDYEKALWFHDWLIHNAYYDLTYSYYSADSILLRGTGVCDGYSKAYQLLLRAVGISTERCTGGDHAWNYVKFDGEWYHIDPTWDDPTGGPETFCTLRQGGYVGRNV